MKRFIKKAVVTIGLMIIAVGAFLAGGIAYKYNQYQKIPGATHLLNLLEQTHFYPAPHQDNVPIFEAKEFWPLPARGLVMEEPEQPMCSSGNGLTLKDAAKHGMIDF